MNTDNPIDRLQDAVGSLPADLVKYGLIALAVLVVLVILWRVLRPKKRPTAPLAVDLTIDVPALGEEGPPAGGPALEYYHVPVRLAAVVLAPAGRVRELPDFGQVAGMIDQIVPGLAGVMSAHRPVVRRWPSQLSTEGFANTFFAHARLPGEGGKGTPWCSAAGVFKIGGHNVLAGLVMRSEAANNLGQTVIQQETKWLDVLRVKQ